MIRTLVFTAALIVSAAAYAQDLDFVVLDTDTNGTLSFAELSLSLTELTEEQFTTLDVDTSGEISAEEFDAYLAAMNTTTPKG